MTRRVVSAAARYLAHDVKIADHRGKRPPAGPYGMSPGEAGYILHHGEIHLRKRAKRRAPVSKARKPAPRRAATRRPTASAGRLDMWNYLAERF